MRRREQGRKDPRDTGSRHWNDFATNRDAPGSEKFWSPELDTASQERLREIHDAKIAAVVPFLYENSPFYRADLRARPVPRDIRNVDDLISKWPVVTKTEMAEDAVAHPPYGTYTAMTERCVRSAAG